MTTPNTPQSASDKLASYLSSLNPVPSFPDYTGPYKVGTVDVEVPVADLESPSPAPEDTTEIHTVQFRVYYPATPSAEGKGISWLPSPQRHHVAAYTQFIGMRRLFAELISFLPRHLHYTSIPAFKNADLHEPISNSGRWPTMIFSHGLGGNRNTYSSVAGSLASHGVVVVCPEHRDGSSVAAFVRIPEAQDKYFVQSRHHVIPYKRISHEVSPEVYEAREDQLRIRLWELGLVHDAILRIDQGEDLTNLNQSTPSLKTLSGRLGVHEPGSIIFAGHSFGACSMVQFIKSTYYAGSEVLSKMEKPLYTPSRGSQLCKQITERSVTMLLDMWCLPITAPNSAPLFDLPLPAYADVPTAPGGKAILAVESEGFFKWKEHLNAKARILSPDPSALVVTSQLYQRPSGIRLPEPNFFYVENSAHLSQSDFGILFPWLTRRIFNSVEPERALRLNLRAQLQVLRANGISVARTSYADLVDGLADDKEDVRGDSPTASDENPSPRSSLGQGLKDDQAIFSREEGTVEYWHWVDTMGLGDYKKADAVAGKGASKPVADMEETAPDMEDEIEPPTAIRRTLSNSAGVTTGS